LNFNFIDVSGIIFLLKTQKYIPPKLCEYNFWNILILLESLEKFLEINGKTLPVSL
jgi:hypothetical protein